MACSAGVLACILDEGVKRGVLACLTVAGIGSVGSTSVFSWAKGTEGLTYSQRSPAAVLITLIHGIQSFSSSSITGVTVITFNDMVIVFFGKCR